MEQLNKTPTQGKFGDVAKVLDTNFGLIVSKLMELETSHKDMNCGFYASSSELTTAWPNPEKGMMAYVGTGDTYTIYRCKADGSWTKTDETFKINISIDLSTFATKTALKSVEDKVTTLMQGAVYGGLAARITNPGVPKTKVFYLPTEVGEYINFGKLTVVENEVAFLYYDGEAWKKHSLDLSSTIEDIKTKAESASTAAGNAMTKANAAASSASGNAKDIKQLKTDVKEVSDKVDGLAVPKIVCLSQIAYDALPTKDPDTTYLTTEE